MEGAIGIYKGGEEEMLNHLMARKAQGVFPMREHEGWCFSYVSYICGAGAGGFLLGGGD